VTIYFVKNLASLFTDSCVIVIAFRHSDRISVPIQHNAKQNKCRCFYVPSRIWIRDHCVKAINTEGVCNRLWEPMEKRAEFILRVATKCRRSVSWYWRGKSVLIDRILRMPHSQAVHSVCKEKNSYPATNRMPICLIELPRIIRLPWLKYFLSFPVSAFANTLQHVIPQYVSCILVDNPEASKQNTEGWTSCGRDYKVLRARPRCFRGQWYANKTPKWTFCYLSLRILMIRQVQFTQNSTSETVINSARVIS
jgi:hypothetical protein